MALRLQITELSSRQNILIWHCDSIVSLHSFKQTVSSFLLIFMLGLGKFSVELWHRQIRRNQWNSSNKNIISVSQIHWFDSLFSHYFIYFDTWIFLHSRHLENTSNMNAWTWAERRCKWYFSMSFWHFVNKMIRTIRNKWHICPADIRKRL